MGLSFSREGIDSPATLSIEIHKGGTPLKISRIEEEVGL